MFLSFFSSFVNIFTVVVNTLQNYIIAKIQHRTIVNNSDFIKKKMMGKALLTLPHSWSYNK